MDQASAILLHDGPPLACERAAPSASKQEPPARPLPQLFDENSVEVDDRRMRYSVRAHLVEELLQAKTGTARRQVLRTALGLMGFDSLVYSLVDGALPEGTRPHAVFHSGAPQDWLQHHFGTCMDRADPRARAARDSATPFVWDLELLASRASAMPSAGDGLLDDMERHEMRSGVSFGIAVPGTALRGIVHLVSSRQHRGFIGDAVLGQALIFAISLHEFLSCCTLPEPESASDAPALTRMERNILAGLSAGEGDKEIGARLCMTHYNVDYHLRILRRKLGGLNRAHLAYLSGRHGLV